MSKEDISLIQCTHGWSKWSIVCKHLCEASSTVWIPIPHDEDENNDWVCPECAEDWNRMMKDHDISKVAAVCIHCVEDIRKVFDPNYKEGGE